MFFVSHFQRVQRREIILRQDVGGGGVQVKTGRLTVLQNFGLKLTLYFI